MPGHAIDTNSADLADQLIDDILRAAPQHRLGTRPIHAPGIAATGWFTATAAASAFSGAEAFSGTPLPVTVRFSNGTGAMDEPDSEPAVRGMAVKFHLGSWTRDAWGVIRSEGEADLITMTVPMFFVNRVDQFPEFVRAATPRCPRPRPLFRTLFELLRLDTPYPSPPPGHPSADPGLFDYAARHPVGCPAVVYLGAKFVPESYTACSYHAVHAFSLHAHDGVTRWVRFHFEPVSGVHAAPAGATGNFLREGLAGRIEAGQAEFVLRVQLAEAGDDVTDPCRPWPTRRPRVVMGHLRLTEVASDQLHGGELLDFNPTRVAGVMGLSPDPILAVRGEVYTRSCARRLAAASMAASTPG